MHDPANAQIILVEPNSKDGRYFAREWHGDSGKVVLDVAWINASIQHGHALLQNDGSNGYGGFGGLDGTDRSTAIVYVYDAYCTLEPRASKWVRRSDLSNMQNSLSPACGGMRAICF